ncbi:hypothetical protein M407DRAFT_124981 [Tulasnella calospora MUT 4182]|uniref:Uncharacterized protein n=1 Tax=Tulasnella calospora MUT 4182 TaxID=1051891 RepID=A0A0C3KJH6_9AGAM|nr:hypothetical protein M407DRAFT_124981 [Tulasnella calospora MUT 4182]
MGCLRSAGGRSLTIKRANLSKPDCQVHLYLDAGEFYLTNQHCALRETGGIWALGSMYVYLDIKHWFCDTRAISTTGSRPQNAGFIRVSQ